MQKRLYRSRKNKVITGVCGGIAEYFAIDPILVRLLWIGVSFAFGTGILAYIVASIIIPRKMEDPTSSFNAGNSTFSGGSAPFESESSPLGNDDSTMNHGINDDFDSESFRAQSDEWRETPKYDAGRTRMIFGVILVLIGLLALTKEFFSWLDFRYFWPFILIGIGALVLFKGGRKSS